jgi:hypothetical protein
MRKKKTESVERIMGKEGRVSDGEEIIWKKPAKEGRKRQVVKIMEDFQIKWEECA